MSDAEFRAAELQVSLDEVRAQRDEARLGLRRLSLLLDDVVSELRVLADRVEAGARESGGV